MNHQRASAVAAVVEETSPLLSPASTSSWETVSGPVTSSDNGVATIRATQQSSLNQQEQVASKGILHLAFLTLPLVGLQIGWSVELAYGSPYLLSLGISKSLLALVWIAGPLSGTLVQPYVGMKSDRCRSRFGRRRIFMISGALATIVSLVTLAWAKEIVEGITATIFGINGPETSPGVRNATILLAVIMVYILDFAINVVQAATRAFIVDGVPTHQQDTANAWASRMSGVGVIVAYLFGYADLQTYFSFFGRTQFQILCILASLMLASTVAISCLNITENDSRSDTQPKQQPGILTFFRDLYHAARSQPYQIKAVCIVQFFAWIGWFPFLFYTTTYIGEIHVRPIFSADPDMSQEEIDAVWERATRIGTFALFMFAITTFIASVVLPFLIGSPVKPNSKPKVTSTPLLESAPSTPRASAMEYFPMRSKTKTTRSRFGILSERTFSPNLTRLSLRRAWLLSHILFAILMWLTFLVRTPTGATILVAFIGIPWAMTNWAPFALIAEEISRRKDSRRDSAQEQRPDMSSVNSGNKAESEQAGVVLGIHNVAIAAPQVVATLVSSAIFGALQKPRGSVGDDSVAWVLRFGGLAALGAAWLTTRVEEK